MHRVVALVRANQSTFELACPAHVFGIKLPGTASQYRFSVCTETPGSVPTNAGHDMHVTSGLDALGQADTIVIPGWLPVDEPPTAAIIEALQQAQAHGTRIVSICSGAFALAYAGLLDGRKATTHWALTDDFAQRFPEVHVNPDVLYVYEDDIASSAGAGAGIDLCIHLIRSDHGARYAADVARRMVMPPHREGGQLQYSAPAHPTHIDDTLAPLLEWITENLSEPLAIDRIAAQGGVSTRTLARRFSDQLGTSPGQWVLAQRISAAQDLLESTELPLDAVARRTGLSSATNLRRRFLNALGTTPGAYRRTFHIERRASLTTIRRALLGSTIIWT